MKLLIVTQKVNEDDAILGFFHRWIMEFAKHFESVVVVCLEEDAHELPVNVKVLSLGKEKGASRLSQMARFYSYILNERQNYDAVFVHMNPIYVVLGGWFWKLSDKKVALWYTHKAVDLKLRVAEKFVDVIFTAVPESFTLKTSKKMVVGHGIDVERYVSARRLREAALKDVKAVMASPISIVSVGRITPIKDPITLIEAARVLKEKWDKKFTVTFIGSPVTRTDIEYFAKVKNLVKEYCLDGVVSFAGDVKPADMPARYAAADISVNLTPTGGLDKVVLESMATGVPVFTSNRAFRDYFESTEKGLAGRLIFKEGDAEDLARKIMALFDRGKDGISVDVPALGKALRQTAMEKADVVALIGRLSEETKALFLL